MTATDRYGALYAVDVAERARRVTAALDEIEARPPEVLVAHEQDDIDFLYDQLVTDAGLRTATIRLFRNKHYADAVRRGCMHVNNLVKKKSGLTTKDGPDLMHHAFKSEAPVLRLNALASQSDHDEQDGYSHILAGMMTGVRNPRAHEPVEDDPEAALEMLTMANHLVRIVTRSKRTRRKAA
jgi:uncharacterized protein (TIGR02391 family)